MTHVQPHGPFRPFKRTARPALLAALCAFAVALILQSGGPGLVSAQTPLATLVPPTLFPTSIPPTAIPPISQSALARIRADRDRPRLSIGILYNAAPFAELNDNGEIIGFEADIGRAFAEDWGIPTGGTDNPPLFRQVTRQNGQALLEAGVIDVLLGQVIITQEREKTLDFSDPYFVNYEVALALGSAPENDIKDLGGKTVGVILGSPAEQAVDQWQKASGVTVTVKKLLMFDDAIRALVAGDINAFVGDRWDLDSRVRGSGLSGLKLLAGAVRAEPYAAAVRTHDYALRMLINRTLQRYAADGRLANIYKQWFPESILPPSQRTIPMVWNDLDKDKRTIYDFPVDITAPADATLPRLTKTKTLRVAGLGAPDSTGQLGALDSFGQALVNEMARRWGGYTVQFVPGAPEDLLAAGSADLAIGLEPHWGNNDTPDRVDFTGVYAVHGYRLLVATARNISAFSDLQIGNGKNLGIFADDEGSFTLAEQIGKSASVVGLRKILIRDDNEISQYVADGTMSAVFGDSLRLVPLSQRFSGFMKLLPQEYTREPIAFAVGRGDSEFRELVDNTLRQMAQDGKYQQLWADLFKIGDPLTMGPIPPQ
jgi:ABC-type amino acid transport substrate-binding protein